MILQRDNITMGMSMYSLYVIWLSYDNPPLSQQYYAVVGSLIVLLLTCSYFCGCMWCREQQRTIARVLLCSSFLCACVHVRLYVHRQSAFHTGWCISRAYRRGEAHILILCWSRACMYPLALVSFVKMRNSAYVGEIGQKQRCSFHNGRALSKHHFRSHVISDQKHHTSPSEFTTATWSTTHQLIVIPFCSFDYRCWRSLVTGLPKRHQY